MSSFDNGAPTLWVFDSTFTGNHAGNLGGGLSNFLGTTAHIVGSTFIGNSTSYRGGGLSAAERLYVTATTFIDNSAERGGGLVVTANGQGRVINSLFLRNSSISTNGAAMRLESNGKFDSLFNTIVGPVNRIAVYIASSTGGITDTIISGYNTGIGVNTGATASELSLVSASRPPPKQSQRRQWNYIIRPTGCLVPV